jgi:hypothetical protein
METLCQHLLQCREETHSKFTNICDHSHKIVISSMSQDFQHNKKCLPNSKLVFNSGKTNPKVFLYLARNAGSSILDVCQNGRDSTPLPIGR